MRNLLPKNQHIVIGQRVHTNLYGHGFGTVYAIHGEQTPQTVQTFGGGVICSGGTAHFDIVFDDGATSSQLPEAILLGVQWKVFDEVKDATFIQERLANAAAHRLSEQREAERRAAAREERRKAAIEAHPHLLRGNDLKTAAKNIRAELKAAFPGVKFSVRSETYAGGDSINVRWQLGPTTREVDAVVRKYQEGHFNGMEDIYEHDHENVWPELFGGANYVQTYREIPAEVRERVGREICALQRVEYRGDDTQNVFGEHDDGWLSTHVHRLLCLTPFPPGAKIRGLRFATDEERKADFQRWAILEFGDEETAAPSTPEPAKAVQVEVLPTEPEPEPATEPEPGKVIDITATVCPAPRQRIADAIAAIEALR